MAKKKTRRHAGDGVVVTNIGAVKDVSSRCPCHPRLCKGGKEGECNHEYFADPVRLFHVVCRFGCGASLDYTQLKSRDVPYYLRIRRKTTRMFGLLSVAAPLDCFSSKLLGESARACGITSNTAILHLTYVDGLWPSSHEPSEIHALRAAVQQTPTMVIDCIHLIHRSDRSTRLVVADVCVDETVQKATDAVTNGDNCTLPQFPFHVALGCISGGDTELRSALLKLEQELVGRTLTVSAGRMKILSPIDFDSWSPWFEADNNDYDTVVSSDLSTATRKTSNRVNKHSDEAVLAASSPIK